MKRAILNLNDVVAYVAIAIVAVIILLLYRHAATQLDERYAEAEAPVHFNLQQGDQVLRTYLETRLDWELERYNTQWLPANVPSRAARIAEALPAILADEACREWIDENGRRYRGATSEGLDEGRPMLSSLTPPSEECSAYFFRSVAFLRSLYGDDYLFHASQGERSFTFGLGVADWLKHQQEQLLLEVDPAGLQEKWITEMLAEADAQILLGTQALPGEPPITVRLVAADSTEVYER